MNKLPKALPTEGSSLCNSEQWIEACDTAYGVTIKPMMSKDSTKETVQRKTAWFISKYLVCAGNFYYEQDGNQIWHSHGTFYERPNLYIKRLVRSAPGWRIFIEPLNSEEAWDRYIQKDQGANPNPNPPSPKDPQDHPLDGYLFIDDDT